jgi:regulatory protein
MERSGVITSVELQKKRKHRYNIYIDHEFAFAVHEDVLMKHQLFKGKALDPEQIRDALRDEERQEAYMRALKWLGFRARSEQEIRMYLQRRQYDESIIDELLERLRAQGYVNDERFSMILTEERLKLQAKGKQWIRRELMQKGIDPETVRKAVSSIEAEDEIEAAERIARKRWNILSKQEDRRKALQKLYAFLSRRGFSASVVSAVVRKFVDSAEDEDSMEEWNG